MALWAVEVRFRGRVRLKHGWPFPDQIRAVAGDRGTFYTAREDEARELAVALDRIPGIDWVSLMKQDDEPVEMAQIELVMELVECERWAMGHATDADSEAMGTRIRAAVFGR